MNKSIIIFFLLTLAINDLIIANPPIFVKIVGVDLLIGVLAVLNYKEGLDSGAKIGAKIWKDGFTELMDNIIKDVKIISKRGEAKKHEHTNN